MFINVIQNYHAFELFPRVFIMHVFIMHVFIMHVFIMHVFIMQGFRPYGLYRLPNVRRHSVTLTASHGVTTDAKRG